MNKPTRSLNISFLSCLYRQSHGCIFNLKKFLFEKSTTGRLKHGFLTISFYSKLPHISIHQDSANL